MSDTIEPTCSFCRLPSSKVTRLIRGASPEVHICDACVLDAVDLIEEHRTLELKDDEKGVQKAKGRPKPSEIVAHLNQYVIGQDEAKKALAVAVYNHYKRIGKNTKTELGKSNVLIVGPTGSGKTHIVETIAKFLDVPFAVADATSITEAGYIGDDVESVLVRLVQASDGDIQKAERGIIYIDEIDKIASREGSGRDVSGEGVQQGLLKMLEGNNVSINPNGKKNANAPQEMINTKEILFICGGAFGSITDTENKPKSMGISEDRPEEYKPVSRKDLVAFGMIPEFVGRFAVLTQLTALREQDMVKILTEPKNSLTKQYTEMLEMDGVKLKFTEEFLLEVAKAAKKEGTGARGLRGILEPVLTDIMFRAPDGAGGEIILTPDLVTKKGKVDE